MDKQGRAELSSDMVFLESGECSVFGSGSSEVWSGVDEDHYRVLRRSFGFV